MNNHWINTMGKIGSMASLMAVTVFVLVTVGAAVPSFADGNDVVDKDRPVVAAGDIKILNFDGDWIKVNMDGFEAWVMSDYLDTKKEQIPLDKESEVFIVSGGSGATPAVDAAIDGKAGTDQEDKMAADEKQERLSAYELAMRKAVDAIVIFLNNMANRRDLTLKERMEKATEFIRFVRWGPEKEYYFWIVDVEGVMVLESQYPHIEGSNVLSFKDLNQKHIFGEFISASLQDEYGYVEHYGLGYDDNKSNARLTIAKVFQQWEWVVGVGQALDHVELYETYEFPINDNQPSSSI